MKNIEKAITVFAQIAGMEVTTSKVEDDFLNIILKKGDDEDGYTHNIHLSRVSFEETDNDGWVSVRKTDNFLLSLFSDRQIDWVEKAVYNKTLLTTHTILQSIRTVDDSEDTKTFTLTDNVGGFEYNLSFWMEGGIWFWNVVCSSTIDKSFCWGTEKKEVTPQTMQEIMEFFS